MGLVVVACTWGWVFHMRPRKRFAEEGIAAILRQTNAETRSLVWQLESPKYVTGPSDFRLHILPKSTLAV